MERVLTMPPNKVWTAEEQQTATAWRDRLRLSMEEAKERDAAAAVDLAFEEAIKRNFDRYEYGVRMVLDALNASGADQNNTLRQLRAKNRAILFPRPPACLGLVPVAGAPLAKTADHRIQLAR